MPDDSPFGQRTRMRVLEEYFETAGPVTFDNAWEHVYKCLLWMNQGAGLAHIYDSNHMQPGGNFHSRAVRFTDALCAKWGITKKQLPGLIDRLFKGCVQVWRGVEAPVDDPEIEGELIGELEALLQREGVSAEGSKGIARRAEAVAKDFFTLGNKRKNALGEGFEDLLFLLLRRVSNVPEDHVALRKPVSKLPGFRRAPARRPDGRREREPHPDIAIVDDGVTHIVATAKWSMRQDRETQFAAEYSAYQRNRTQPTELRFALITNEFDVARLDNVARAIPTGAGGYIFHNIYHINPELLRTTQGERIGPVGHWMGAGKILSLENFLREMKEQYGAA